MVYMGPKSGNLLYLYKDRVKIVFLKTYINNTVFSFSKKK